jgi:hypothetical protein
MTQSKIKSRPNLGKLIIPGQVFKSGLPLVIWTTQLSMYWEGGTALREGVAQVHVVYTVAAASLLEMDIFVKVEHKWF